MIQDIAVLVGAVFGGGGIGAIVTRIWVQKRLDNKQDVNNFQTLFNEISKDVARVRDEQAEERRQWAEERKAFNKRIDDLQTLVRTQDGTIHKKDILVTQLTGKVELLQSQVDIYRDQHIPKSVTVNT